MDYLTTLAGQNIIGLLAVALFIIMLKRNGIDFIALLKGSNGNKQMDEMQDQIKLLSENHMHEIKELLQENKNALRELNRALQELLRMETETLITLKSIKDDLRDRK